MANIDDLNERTSATIVDVTIEKEVVDDEVHTDKDEADFLVYVENSDATKAVTHNDEPVMVDIKNKMSIIYNVLKACIKEQNRYAPYHVDDFVNRMVYLTKLDSRLLQAIIHKTKSPIETYIHEANVIETPKVDYEIRQTLLKKYYKLNVIPKGETLEKIICNYSYNYELNQQLKISGYIWKRLPNTKRAIIIEHPKRVLARQRYLNQMNITRKEKRPILYVDTKIFSKNDKNIGNFHYDSTEDIDYIVVVIAVNNLKGLVDGHIFGCKSIFRCQKIVEDHIIKKVLPLLTEPSMLIIEDKMYYSKTLPVPLIESEKSEMIHWLKINGIPHETNLHRSELFELIERCKGKVDLHNFDVHVKSLGHKILRRPPRTDYLNYFRPLWEKLSLSTQMTTFISKSSIDIWKSLENSLKRMEQTVDHEDVAMENIIDKILTMANSTNVEEWANNECDEEEDSLAREKVIIECKQASLLNKLDKNERRILFEIKPF